MNNKIPDHVVTQSTIRKIIKGFDTFEHSDSDPFYQQYKESWNKLLKDIEDFNGHKNGTSFFMILEAASSSARTMYQRCSSKHLYLIAEVKTFTHELRDLAHFLSAKKRSAVYELADIWDQATENNNYCITSQFTFLLQLTQAFSDISIDHELDNLEYYIGNMVTRIERKIMELALKYHAFRGLDDAYRYAQMNNKLIKCSEYMKVHYGKTKNVKWIPPIHREIKDLVLVGHLIDAATKLRFITLSKGEGHTHQECYDIIENELLDIGIKPKDILPEEAKSLADRASRYTKKRLKEFKQVTRNISR